MFSLKCCDFCCFSLKEYIARLKNENKTLTDNMISIRDAAIEAVMDKEQEIAEAKAKMEEMETFFKEQVEISLNSIQVLEGKLAHYESSKSNHSSLFMDKIKQLEVFYRFRQIYNLI